MDTNCVAVGECAHLIVVVTVRESLEPAWVQLTTPRIQLHTVILRQLGAERVDGNDECATIRFKLNTAIIRNELMAMVNARRSASN